MAKTIIVSHPNTPPARDRVYRASPYEFAETASGMQSVFTFGAISTASQTLTIGSTIRSRRRRVVRSAAPVLRRAPSLR